MNIREISILDFGGYRVENSILKIKICPHCKDENFNFVYNTMTGTTICSKCKDIGTIDSLSKKIGKPIEKEKIAKTKWIPIKSLLPSKTLIKKISKICSETTLKRENISIQDGGESLFFIHLDTEKVLKGVKKINKEGSIDYFADSLNSLWNCENVTDKEVIITTSEVEALALIDKGVENVVGIAKADNLNFIDEMYDYLNKKEKVIIIASKNFLENFELDLIHRIGKSKTFTIELSKDTLIKELESNIDIVEKLKEIATLNFEVNNVVDIYDIEENKYDSICIASGERYWDRLLGGTRMGEVTTLTGFPASGKSTILEQCIVSFTDNNESVFIFSGESKASKLKNRLYQLIAGKEYIKVTKNPYNELIYQRSIASKEVYKEIDEYMRGKIHIFEYDKTARDIELIKAIEECYRKKGTRIFVIDNIMTVSMSSEPGEHYTGQKQFMIALKDLTKRYPIQIILVAHPKKVPEKDIDMFSIHGASEIPNLSDNIILVRRLNEKEIAKIKENEPSLDPSSELRILKDREHGRIGARGLLSYDKMTGRIYSSDSNANRKYRWK